MATESIPGLDDAAANSASQIRYDKAAVETARHMLSIDPEYQSEVIARHYTSLATLALELLKLVEMRRHPQGRLKAARSLSLVNRHFGRY